MPIQIKWESEITKIRKDLNTLQKENVTLREKLRGVATEAKKGAQGHDEMGRAAKRVLREIETPAERYRRKMEELNRLLKAGAIDQDAYGRAARRVRDEAERAGRSTRQMFDLPGLRTAIGLLGGMGVTVSVAAALQKIIGYAQQAREEIKGIAEGLRQTHEGAKAIWQVSESKQAYESLSARVRLAMAKEGMTREQAQAMVFNLQSLQQIEAAPVVAMATRFMPADIAAQFVTTLRSPTTWGKQAGTPQQILSGLIEGAGRSMFNVQETAKWAARVSPTLKAAGATPAEILGVGAAISVPAQEPEILGTYMFALEKEISTFRQEQAEAAKRIMPMDFVGTVTRAALEEVAKPRGLIQGFKDLQANAEAMAEAMKEQRFKRAAIALTGALEDAETNTRKIAEAFRTDALFRQKVESLPRTLNIQQQMAVAEARKEVALEPQGLAQMQLNTLIAQNKAVAAMLDKSLVAQEFWEETWQRAATFGQIEKAKESAAEQLLRMLKQGRPELYEQFIGDLVPIRRPRFGPATVRGRPNPLFEPDLPGPPTAIQEEAISRAMGALVDELVRQRQATEDQANAARDLADTMRQPNLGTLGAWFNLQDGQGPAVHPWAMFGLPPLLQPSHVILAPKDETAEVGFTAN